MLACHIIYYLAINIRGQCAYLMLQLPGLQISLSFIIKTLRLYTYATIATHLRSSITAPRRCWLSKLLVVLLSLLLLNERTKVASGNWFYFTLQREQLHF